MYGCNRFDKKIALDDRWMAEAARLRKKWTTGSGVLKKILLSLQKRDA